MKLQPLLPLWLILPYIGAIAGSMFWFYWKKRQADKAAHKPKPRTKDTRPLLARVNWIVVRRTAILLMPALVAIGPSVQGGVSSPGIANLDVIFAVDTTPSMNAVDYMDGRSRLEGAKQDMAALAAELKGAHFEVITFDTEANVVLPMTSDATAFASALEGLVPQISSYSQGSGIDKPLKLIGQELKNSADAYPERYRLLFYLGDGEQTAEAKVQAFTAAGKNITGGAVLGYGTEKGERILKNDGLNDESATKAPEYITTIDQSTNQLVPAISKLDAAALRKIASEMKVQYHDRNQGGAITDVYQSSKAQLAIDKSQRVVHYLNLYWLMAAVYVALLSWEWHLLISKYLDLKSQSGQTKPATKKGARNGR